MRIRAWPYAVARGQSVGYQAIVVPDFLAEAGEAYLLEYSSRSDAGPEAFVIRAVPESSTGPVTIVYRYVKPTSDRYGIADQAPLRDRAGRDIGVFEGLVLRQSVPAGQATPLGITTADMDRVTTRIAPAFRRLWEATDAIEADHSTAIPVGSESPGTEALRPHVVADDPRPVRNGYRVAAGLAVVAILVVVGLVLASHGPFRSLEHRTINPHKPIGTSTPVKPKVPASHPAGTPTSPMRNSPPGGPHKGRH